MVATIAIITGIVGLIVIIVSYYLAQLLLKYIHGKDYKKSRTVTTLDQKLSKKQKLIIIWLPIFVALLFVILYSMLSEKKLSNFISFGCISVVINLAIVFINALSKKDEYLKAFGGYYSVAIISILTLIIPFTSYYLLLSFIIAGIRIPFTY